MPKTKFLSRPWITWSPATAGLRVRRNTDRRESSCARPVVRLCALRRSLRRRRPFATSASFGRGEIGGRVLRQDRRSVGRPELGVDRGLVPRRRQAGREASIHIGPSLVPRRPDDQRHVIERAVLVQRARLIGNVQTVDHRAPGDARRLGELLLAVGKCEQHLRRGLGPHAGEHLRRVRAPDRRREIVAQGLGVRERRPSRRRVSALHDRAAEVAGASAATRRGSSRCGRRPTARQSSRCPDRRRTRRCCRGPTPAPRADRGIRSCPTTDTRDPRRSARGGRGSRTVRGGSWPRRRWRPSVRPASRPLLSAMFGGGGQERSGVDPHDHRRRRGRRGIGCPDVQLQAVLVAATRDPGGSTEDSRRRRWHSTSPAPTARRAAAASTADCRPAAPRTECRESARHAVVDPLHHSVRRCDQTRGLAPALRCRHERAHNHGEQNERRLAKSHLHDGPPGRRPAITPGGLTASPGVARLAAFITVEASAAEESATGVGMRPARRW